MIRRPSRSTRTDTLFPYTTFFRSDLLDGRPGEQQARLADPREADDDLRLVALTLHLEHHALAELGVHDVVADLDPERLGAVLGRARAARPGRESLVDDAVAAS